MTRQQLFIRLSMFHRTPEAKNYRFKKTVNTRHWCKAMQRVSFTGNLDQVRSTIFFNLEEAIETILFFLERVFVILYLLDT